MGICKEGERERKEGTLLEKGSWVVKWGVNRVRHVAEMAAVVEGRDASFDSLS